MSKLEKGAHRTSPGPVFISDSSYATNIPSASKAVSFLKQKRLQRRDHWHLDGPAEAALVAQLCDRQKDEEVVVSEGNPKPEPGYCFAHLGPSYFRSDKDKHYYALGQYPYHCAEQRRPAEQQKQLQRLGLAPQHAEHPDTQPCSPVAASPQHTTDQPCRPSPMIQLGAEGSTAKDSSPANKKCGDDPMEGLAEELAPAEAAAPKAAKARAVGGAKANTPGSACSTSRLTRSSARKSQGQTDSPAAVAAAEDLQPGNKYRSKRGSNQKGHDKPAANKPKRQKMK